MQSPSRRGEQKIRAASQLERSVCLGSLVVMVEGRSSLRAAGARYARDGRAVREASSLGAVTRPAAPALACPPFSPMLSLSTTRRALVSSARKADVSSLSTMHGRS